MQRLPFVATLIVCLNLTLGAQPPNAPAVPTAALYRAFFYHTQSLEKAASDLEAQGKTGQELRSYYQNKIGLSGSDAATIKQFAVQGVNAVQEVDRRAKAIIDQESARHPGGRVASMNEISKPPVELAQLTQLRDDVTNAQIQGLRAALGDASFAKVDGYIRTHFAVQVKPVPAPGAAQPAGLRPAPPAVPRNSSQENSHESANRSASIPCASMPCASMPCASMPCASMDAPGFGAGVNSQRPIRHRSVADLGFSRRHLHVFVY